MEKPSEKHENSRRTCDICARTVEPEHAGRWGDAFKRGEACREPTLRVQGGTLINKEAWFYRLTTPLCPSRASVFTHPPKRGEPRPLGECLPSSHREALRKVTVADRLRAWWSAGDSSRHGCILQRDVLSQGAWRRQEVYTESSGPKEGRTDPAQAPPVHVRWVCAPGLWCCTTEAKLA